MKIRIDFSNEEKEALFSALGVKAQYDKSQKAVGKYGELSYFKETNMISMNLSERFVVASATLITNICNMVKAMFQMCEDFSDIWSEGEKVEDIKLVCPVTRIKKD